VSVALEDIAKALQSMNPEEKAALIGALSEPEETTKKKSKKSKGATVNAAATEELNNTTEVVVIKNKGPVRDEEGEIVCERTGLYRVSLTHYSGTEQALSLQQIHKDGPIFWHGGTYELSLCPHELEFVKGVPGFMFAWWWRFDIEALS